LSSADLVFSDKKSLKIEPFVFFLLILSLYVYPKHLENTLYILINSSIALKQNKTKHTKLEINPKPKNFMSSDIFFRQFKDEKISK